MPVAVVVQKIEEEGCYNQKVERKGIIEEMQLALKNMKYGRVPDGRGVMVVLLKKAHGKVHVMILNWINDILEGGKVPYDMMGSIIKLIY